jgi:hypothetical protein
MVCRHDGFHSIVTSYDRRDGILTYHWICERCGTRLGEARRETYRPSYVRGEAGAPLDRQAVLR